MRYTFLLKQHIGVKSQAMVCEGNIVKRGELIAIKPKGQLGTNLFSSVNGKVLTVTEDKIMIEATETDFNRYKKLQSHLPKDLIEEAGLVGLGGAGFPVYAKLDADLANEGTVIINAVECEPILNHNIARIERDPEKLLRALEIIMKIVHAKRGIVAIKKVNVKAIQRLKKANADQRYEIAELENLYPMGEERAIIRETMGFILSTDALPKESGIIVINAETALRVREAVEDKKPFIDKDLTIAGKLLNNGGIHIQYDLPIGLPVADAFEMAGGIQSDYGEIIMGGPFTGKRTTLDSPVVKTTGGLIATETFLKGPEQVGLLVCACGADEERLNELAQDMGSNVIGVEYCKQIKQKGTAYKCENPGRCPGQVEKVLKLKKNGANALLISNCTDCTNTVMSCAPKLGLPVYHCTDASLRAVNHKLIRRSQTDNQ